MTSNTYFKHEGPWSDANDPLLCSDTGGWRTRRPVIEVEKCIFCGLCAVYCPIQVMEMVEGSHFFPDLNFCKGCGICASECPKNAVKMISEREFTKKNDTD